MPRYRPYWLRIIFVAAFFHILLLSACAVIYTLPIADIPAEDLQEIEWVEVDFNDSPQVEDLESEIPEVAEVFPDIEFPPIEIPQPPEPAVTESEPPQVESPKPVAAESKAEGEKKSDEDDRGKIKVLTKVFPKDVVGQLIAAGILKERPVLKSGKIVIAITVGLDGKMHSIEFRRGGGNDERGNMINIVAEAAASGWIFAPFIDEDGNPKEIKTQIEFKPEDF